VHIIAGYLRSKFAQDKPLSLAASICFEQSYSESMAKAPSSTEIYALASALSGLPLRPDYRRDRLDQPAGRYSGHRRSDDENRRILDVCRIKGLTGTQGVMMPESKWKI